MNIKAVYILGIESSCDETSASVSRNGRILSNITAGQEIHARYGGVVPELASRAHQLHIVPVIDAALKDAGVTVDQLDAIAFTRGPGLIGSLLVGTSFAKGMALSLNIPLIEVNHMQAHVIANFTFREQQEAEIPDFPFLCLTVSGGHTQIVLVKDFLKMELIGQTQDDAAGEAFDKIAKMLELPYPGGPFIDRLAVGGNPFAYKFPHPHAPGLDFSFSGLKTAVLYFLKKERLPDPNFPGDKMADVCASVQETIVRILINKVRLAAKETGISTIALAGGVSANSHLRKTIKETGIDENWKTYIPDFEFCTDNAGMISAFAYHKYLAKEFCSIATTPLARLPL